MYMVIRRGLGVVKRVQCSVGVGHMVVSRESISAKVGRSSGVPLQHSLINYNRERAERHRDKKITDTGDTRGLCEVENEPEKGPHERG
jgi:hypothetical protein